MLPTIMRADTLCLHARVHIACAQLDFAEEERELV